MEPSRRGQLKEMTKGAGRSLFSRLFTLLSSLTIKKWKSGQGKVVFIDGPPFELRNLKNERYDELEALTAFAVSVAAVAREYHVNYSLRPRFVLVLGSDKEEISWPQGNDWVGGELHLRKWDARLFRAGVIALTINELIRPRNVLRLEREIAHRENMPIKVMSLSK